jgi:soluble lytic murein transglycosylase-like protein
MGLRLLLGAGLAGATSPSSAAYACLDAFGQRYVVERPFGEAADVHCEPIDEPPSEPVRVDPTGLPSPLAGRLVLAPRMGADLRTPRPSRRAEFDPLIEAVARLYGLDADLLRAIVQVESSFDPDAISARGAIGLMQIMPSTAAELGLSRPQETLFQPESNLRIGALYLRRLSSQFPSATELVVAAYNAGENAVKRCGNAIPPYPETLAYVRDVLAIYNELHASR